MDVQQFQTLVPDAPELPATVAASTDANAIEAYLIQLLRHSAGVESVVNATVDSSERTNKFGWRVDEAQNFRASLNVPVSLSTLQVA